MLDDFAQSGSKAGRRFGASLAASIVFYGSIGAGVVAASAAAGHAVVQDELVQVAFAPLPEPELPPPPPPPPPPELEVAPEPPARLGRPRPQLEQPEEIPEERPDESDAQLTPPEDPFAPEGEGDPNGVAGGALGGHGAVAVAALPEPEPEPAPVRPRGPVRVIEGSTPPVVDRAEIIQHFDVPAAVRSSGVARITLVVRVTVDATGHLTDVSVLRGHPLIPEENIFRAVRAAHFEPARMSDGTPYAAIHTIPITIAVTL